LLQQKYCKNKFLTDFSLTAYKASPILNQFFPFLLHQAEQIATFGQLEKQPSIRFFFNLKHQNKAAAFRPKVKN
jgi:hypothetical protein